MSITDETVKPESATATKAKNHTDTRFKSGRRKLKSTAEKKKQEAKMAAAF
jgi:hypothetical protein